MRSLTWQDLTWSFLLETNNDFGRVTYVSIAIVSIILRLIAIYQFLLCDNVEYVAINVSDHNARLIVITRQVCLRQLFWCSELILVINYSFELSRSFCVVYFRSLHNFLKRRRLMCFSKCEYLMTIVLTLDSQFSSISILWSRASRRLTLRLFTRHDILYSA